MMLYLTQYYLRKFIPWWCGWLTRFLYASSQICIGRNFRTDSIPRILIDKGCRIIIGDNVEFRRNIEIRSHGQSTIEIGHNTRIDRGVRILAANNANVCIQEGARIGLYSVLNGGDSISIGKKTLISGFVYLQTSMHGFISRNASIQDQGYLHAPVNLGEDVWLGTHVVIMPGVTIGTGSVIGSNAVVTKNIDSYQVAVGIPAQPVKER